MTQRMLFALTLCAFFVESSSAQMSGDSPKERSSLSLPDPASMQPPPDGGATTPPAATSPMPGNGASEQYARGTSNGQGAGFWLSADYLSGFFQPARLPPLVTTSTAGTPRAQAGVLGLPTTSVLFDGSVNGDVRAGSRIGAGYWFDSDRTWGLEVGFSVFESQSTFFSETSSGILARPFTNAVTGLPDSVVIAFPGSGSGSLAARDSSGNFYETHLDIYERICGCEWFRLYGLVGYRFFRYDEGLQIQQNMSPMGAAFAPGTQIRATDSFVAENEFNGFDLGFKTEVRGNSWALKFLTKLATGGIFRNVRIRGTTTTTVPGVVPVTRTGGVLALTSNIGDHRSEDWTIFPEFGINWSWQISSRLQMRIGYSFLFMNDIARAHDQVNLTVNPGLFPPPTAAAGSPNQPSFMFRFGDEWIQAVSVGFEYTF